jgi:hypothetical protein
MSGLADVAQTRGSGEDRTLAESGRSQADMSSLEIVIGLHVRERPVIQCRTDRWL